MSDATTPFVIKKAEQLQAIADPFRQRLLHCFARPRTAKEAAERLEVSVTRLYRHIDQLLAAGLIKVVSEERRRAAVERTFQAVAGRFVVSPPAFGAKESRGDRRTQFINATIQQVLAEADSAEGAVRIARTQGRLTQEAVEHIEAEMARLIRELCDDEAPEVELLLLSARGKTAEGSTGAGS